MLKATQHCNTGQLWTNNDLTHMTAAKVNCFRNAKVIDPRFAMTFPLKNGPRFWILATSSLTPEDDAKMTSAVQQELKQYGFSDACGLGSWTDKGRALGVDAPLRVKLATTLANRENRKAKGKTEKKKMICNHCGKEA